MTNEHDKVIGSRINLIRSNLGLSMEDFGKILNPPATKGTVSKWESGKYIPNNERLKMIAKLGNTTVAYLLRPATGEISMDTAVDVAKDIYNKKLSNKTKLRDETSRALEYFNNDSLDLVLEQEVSRYFSNPQVAQSENLRNLGNSSDFETHIIDYLEIRYKKEVPTNQHLIEMISKGIPDNPDDYEDFTTPTIAKMPLKKVLEDNPQLISSINHSELETLANKGAILYFGNYENAVDLNLKKEIAAILEDSRKSINALFDKYPDNPSQIEQDTKVFADGLEWWHRGKKEEADTLNLSVSTKKEIIALGNALLAEKDASAIPNLPESPQDKLSDLDRMGLLYGRDSRY